MNEALIISPLAIGVVLFSIILSIGITYYMMRNSDYIMSKIGQREYRAINRASMTADPHGTIISRANEAEQLIFVDLDPALVDSTRSSFPVGNDRRDTLYRDLVK